MEFHIRLSGPTPDPGVIEHAVRAVDPAALADIEPRTRTLRVATSIGAAHLVALIAEAGYPVAPHEVAQVPSICCGGCSG